MIIWYKDTNHRVYPQDENGKHYGSPIEREYWRPLEVVSETTRSWVLSNGIKVPKKTRFPSANLASNEQQVDGIVWQEQHSYKIAEAVAGLNRGIDRYQNLGVLREIAKLVGYETAP